LHPVRGLGL